MKRVIRKGTWESASSSVHTLVISEEGLEPSKLPVDKDGYIITDFGSFGEWDEGITTFDQDVKLSYIATECYYINHWETNIEDCWVWKSVCEAVCEYTGAPGVKLLNEREPELNHQVQPEYGELKFCDSWDTESIKGFIFNRFAGIKMSHD